MSDDQLAGVAQVTGDMISAFRAGVPFWKLQMPGAAERIANAIGVDPQLVKAKIAQAHRSKWGRGASSFASATTRQFNGVRISNI